jgi:hypothetical protein
MGIAALPGSSVSNAGRLLACEKIVERDRIRLAVSAAAGPAQSVSPGLRR